MTIEFELTRDDYWAFNRFVMMKRFPGGRALLLIVGGLVFALTLTAMVLHVEIPWELLVWFPLLLVLWFALLPYLAKRAIKRLPDEHGGTIGHHRVTLDDHGIHDETAMGTSFQKWAGVGQVVDDAAHIYVFVDRMAAHVIPKRAFDPEGLRAFLAAVHEGTSGRRSA